MNIERRVTAIRDQHGDGALAEVISRISDARDRDDTHWEILWTVVLATLMRDRELHSPSSQLDAAAPIRVEHLENMTESWDEAR